MSSSCVCVKAPQNLLKPRFSVGILLIREVYLVDSLQVSPVLKSGYADHKNGDT